MSGMLRNSSCSRGARHEDVGVAPVVAVDLADVAEVGDPLVHAGEVEVGGTDRVDRPRVAIEEAAHGRDVGELLGARRPRRAGATAGGCRLAADFRVCHSYPHYTSGRTACSSQRRLDVIVPHVSVLANNSPPRSASAGLTALRFQRWSRRQPTRPSGKGQAVEFEVQERIWRAEGLKVPKRQPKRGRLWLADGSCIRLRPEHRNHVWAYDFVAETTHDGRKLRLLTVIDEYTRECLAIRVERRMTANDVLWVLADLFLSTASPSTSEATTAPSSSLRRSRLARRPGRHDALHRARLTLGERLHRVVQLQAA